MRAHRMRASGIKSAFPSIANTQESSSGSSSTSFSVLMPTGITAGQALVMIVRYFEGPTAINTPAGWALLSSTINASYGSMAIFAKTAVGGDGTVSVTTTAAVTNKLATVLRLENFYGVVANGAAAASGNSGGTSPDPPSCSAPWGSAKNLWIACATAGNGASVTTYPANYTLNQTPPGWAAPALTFAARERVASSENPGAFSISAAAAQGMAATIVVRGT